MVTQWERFAKRSDQTIRDLGGENAIEITNGTGGYNGPGDSGNTSYPDTPDATLDAETAAPSAMSGVEQSGTFEGIDQLAWIDADTTATIVSYGDTDQPPTRVKVLENGETFEVESTTQSGDGYIRLDMREL